MSLNSEMVRRILMGEATSDTAIKREIVKQIIYKASDLIAVGTKVLPVKNLNVLDVKFTYPTEMAAEYPVPEGRRAFLEEIEWPEFGYSLKKGQARFRITTEARIRGIDNAQQTYSMRRCAEAIAKKQDEEILDAIIAGAGQTVTIASGNEWDTANGDPEKDIVDARQLIVDNSNVTDAELNRLCLIVGTNVSSELLKLQLIGNVQTALRDYLKTAFNITMFETRDADFADIAILLVNSDNTGQHGIFTGPLPELVVDYPVHGVGREWLVTKFFATKIMPESTTQTTSNRIVKISNTKS